MTKSELEALVTEAQNPRTLALDRLSTLELLTAMNDEDRGVAAAVAAALPQIAAAADDIAARVRAGGRLVYCGAGSSGRLGVLDAVECPPTFSIASDQVVGVVAGGPIALQQSVEGAEDDPRLGAADLKALQLAAADCVVGISASGRTPYVLGALAYARQVGALTVALACNSGSATGAAAQHLIEVVTGPEVLAGSTRLKAGTAQKLVLNMLSTALGVALHKVYGNLMVDLQTSNDKLRARARRIVAGATNRSLPEAAEALQQCDGQAKVAIVTLQRGCTPAVARALLASNGGSVQAALVPAP